MNEVMDIIVEKMNSESKVQILDKAVCNSLYADDHWKSIYPFLLSPPGKTGFFSFGTTTSPGEGKLNSNRMYSTEKQIFTSTFKEKSMVSPNKKNV